MSLNCVGVATAEIERAVKMFARRDDAERFLENVSRAELPRT